MPGIVCKAVDSAGGAQIAGGQSKVRIRGQLVVVLGDPVEPHGIPPHSPMPVMVQASTQFRIQGKQVCREGDAASCGHTSTGRPFFIIP